MPEVATGDSNGDGDFRGSDVVFAFVIEFPNRTFQAQQCACLFIQFGIIRVGYESLAKRQTIHLHTFCIRMNRVTIFKRYE